MNNTYRWFQESKHTYFPHSDCFEKLGLSITEGKPNKMYCLGEVVDREYCQTRKVRMITLLFEINERRCWFQEIKLLPGHLEIPDLAC